jgi:hypothetical protein
MEVNLNYFHSSGSENNKNPTTSLYKISLFSLKSEKVEHGNPCQRTKATLTKLDENTLLLVGGENVVKFNTIYRYSIEEKEWELDVPDGDFPERCGHTVNLYDTNMLIMYGGEGKTKEYNTLYYLKYDLKGTSLLTLSRDLSDLIIKIGDKHLYGHKALFSQTNILKNVNPDTNQVDLEDVNGDMFYRLCKYLYGKPLIVEGPELIPLIEMSRKFEFKELELHVVNQLRELKPIEIVNILSKTEEKVRRDYKQKFYSEDLIKQLCFEFYQENKEEFNNLECYKAIQHDMDEDLRLELLVSPDVKDEEHRLVPADVERVKSLNEHLSSLVKKKEYSDLKLISKDGTSFDFHKILFYGAPFLKKKSSNEIKFDSVESSVLEIVWKVIYDASFELDVTSEKLFNKFQKEHNFGLESSQVFPGSKLL